MNSYIVNNHYYDSVTPSEDYSICHCSSSSLSDYEPKPISERFVGNTKPLVSQFNDYFKNTTTPNSAKSNERLTSAFLTGPMLSMKQRLEPRLVSTDLTLTGNHTDDTVDVGTFLCPKQNLNWANHSLESDDNGIEEMVRFNSTTPDMSSSIVAVINIESESDDTIKGISCMSCNTNPKDECTIKKYKSATNHTHSKKTSCVVNNNLPGNKCNPKPIAKGKRRRLSMTKTPETINISSGRHNMNKPNKGKQFYFHYVKPFNVLEKPRKVNKTKKYARDKVPCNVKNSNRSTRNLRKPCKHTKNQNFKTKKRNSTLVGISSEISINFKSTNTSCLTVNPAQNIAKIDIHLKNSEELVAVAKIIIEALNQNAKNSDHTNVLSSCVSFPITRKICNPSIQTLKKKKKKKKIARKLTPTSESLQICLDRFSSVFEKERQNLFGMHL